MAKVDFKQAAVDHVEKAVFGIAVLVVVLGLAGTNWAPYQGTPREIEVAVQQGKQNHDNNTWPEDEEAKYALADRDAPANIVHEHLFRPIDPRPFEVATRMHSTPWDGSEPLREPVLVAPEEMIADASRVLLQMADQRDALEEEDKDPATDKKKEKDDNVPDEFRTRQAGTGGAGGRGEPGMMGGGEEYADMAVELAYADAGEYDEMYDGMGEGGHGGRSRPELNGQGRHFASIRAVFNVRDQIRKYADAINKSYAEAAQRFEILDFELQRQSAQLGEEDPWSGPWEPVDLDVAFDILDNTSGYEPDVVSTMVTNSVITMPLPMRISGQWRKLATHPRIKNFQLTEEQIQREVELNRKLLADAVEQRQTTRQTVVQRGGFSRNVFDGREITAQLLGAESMYDMEMDGMGYDEMGATGGVRGRGMRAGRPAARNDRLDKLIERLVQGSANKREEERELRKWITERVSVEGELLLFRYLDFSVEPGKTYRYRVRFVLNNPNFGRNITEAGGFEHVVQGQTRTTDWSNASEPVTIEPEVRYFVGDIRKPTGQRILPTIRMDVFQWDPKFGTTMNQKLELHLGQKIHETAETTVIDPAKHVYESQKYSFSSEAYLVDALEDIEIDEQFHASDPKFALELPRGSRGRLGLLDKVLVHTEEGDLHIYDPERQEKKHSDLRTYQQFQTEQFKHIKESRKMETDLAGLEGFEDLMYDEMMMEEMGTGRRGGRNPFRQGRGGRGRAGGMEP
jgi:hypothetical protein